MYSVCHVVLFEYLRSHPILYFAVVPRLYIRAETNGFWQNLGDKDLARLRMHWGQEHPGERIDFRQFCTGVRLVCLMMNHSRLRCSSLAECR